MGSKKPVKYYSQAGISLEHMAKEAKMLFDDSQEFAIKMNADWHESFYYILAYKNNDYDNLKLLTHCLRFMMIDEMQKHSAFFGIRFYSLDETDYQRQIKKKELDSVQSFISKIKHNFIVERRT